MLPKLYPRNFDQTITLKTMNKEQFDKYIDYATKQNERQIIELEEKIPTLLAKKGHTFRELCNELSEEKNESSEENYDSYFIMSALHRLEKQDTITSKKVDGDWVYENR